MCKILNLYEIKALKLIEDKLFKLEKQLTTHMKKKKNKEIVLLRWYL